MNKALQILVSSFIKNTGRKPNNLEMILLKQKLMNQAIDERKVVSMIDRSPVNPNNPIMGGKNIEETEDQIRQRFMKRNKEGIEQSRKGQASDFQEKVQAHQKENFGILVYLYSGYLQSGLYMTSERNIFFQSILLSILSSH